jgi:hypothetical protein
MSSALFSSTPITGTEGSCMLQLPAWRLDPSAAAALIDEAFTASRRAADLPLAERMALDAQLDGLIATAELPCRPSTSGTLPDEIFTDPALGLGGDDHLLDIGAGDGRLGATAVLVHGVASASGIEMAAARVADGCRALQRLATKLNAAAEVAPFSTTSAGRWAAATQTLELRVGDARTAPFGAATTRVLTYATCFPRSLAQARAARKKPACSTPPGGLLTARVCARRTPTR